MVRGYGETTGCRRQFLLGYFGEQLPRPCGNCDTCEAGTAQTRRDTEEPFPCNRAVQHAQWGHGVVMSTEQDRLTVLFDDGGYKTLALAAVQKQNLLAPDHDTPPLPRRHVEETVDQGGVMSKEKVAHHLSSAARHRRRRIRSSPRRGQPSGRPRPPERASRFPDHCPALSIVVRPCPVGSRERVTY
jgi:superfamily II DNA helicase RecQ